MKPLFLFLHLFLFFFTALNAQSDLNLDFEIINRDGNAAVNWASVGSHIAFVDAQVKKQGQFSIRLENTPKADPRKWSYFSNSMVMADYVGKEISLRGYVKTENLKGGASLYMHQQGGSFFKPVTINLDNMEQRRLNGTTEWTALMLKMPFPNDLYQIEFGIYVEGEGKVWADDLKLLIDGKPLSINNKRHVLQDDNVAKDKKTSHKSTKPDPYYQQKAKETMERRKGKN